MIKLVTLVNTKYAFITNKVNIELIKFLCSPNTGNYNIHLTLCYSETKQLILFLGSKIANKATVL